jgi:hypothetical protein
MCKRLHSTRDRCQRLIDCNLECMGYALYQQGLDSRFCSSNASQMLKYIRSPYDEHAGDRLAPRLSSYTGREPRRPQRCGWEAPRPGHDAPACAARELVSRGHRAPGARPTARAPGGRGAHLAEVHDMRSRTATPQGDRSEIEAAALTDHIPARQIRHWITAHRLQACRACTGFRIAELGPADLISSPDSGRSPRPGGTNGSGPWFASAGTWRR